MNLNGWAISTELFNWILENIPKGSTILELGSGRGTRELVKHYNVYSVEHDKKWLNLVPQSIYIHAPLVDNWYDVEILKELLPKKYDVLLIDGPPAEKRVGVIKHSNLFKTDIPIIIDDSNRKLDATVVNHFMKDENKKVVEVVSKEKKASILLPI
jgi:hypothetical protein